MTYFVVLPDGQKFGPADINLLNQWVTEGRILPNTMLEDSTSGRQLPASSVPGIQLAVQQEPGQPPYSGYYRGAAVIDNGHNDVTLSYVFGSLGILACFGDLLCGLCGLVGLIFPILGIVFATNAAKKGNPNAGGARLIGWIGLTLQVLALIGVATLFAFGSFWGG